MGRGSCKGKYPINGLALVGRRSQTRPESLSEFNSALSERAAFAVRMRVLRSWSDVSENNDLSGVRVSLGLDLESLRVQLALRVNTINLSWWRSQRQGGDRRGQRRGCLMRSPVSGGVNSDLY